MKAIDRLYSYFESKKIKPTVFERTVGFSSGYLSNMKKRYADLGEGAFLNINDYCHDINIEWLITGKGEMIKLKPDLSSAGQSNKMLLDKIIELTKENTLLCAEIDQLNEQKNTHNQIIQMLLLQNRN